MNHTNHPFASSSWQVYGASSIGKSHIDSSLPNQDSIYFDQSESCTVAVVCDGAGSAKFSQDGAKFFSQSIGQMLLDLNASHIDLSQAKNQIVEQLQQIRVVLQSQLTSESTLRDYHTTFTGLLINSTSQALLVQIGDSPLITSKFEVINNQIDYFTNLQIYSDESKNEYVNETHFITQDNWLEFLKIELIDVAQVDCIALMSDGCADLVFEGAVTSPQIYRPFFGNLLFNLTQSQTNIQGSGVIEQALSNSATYRLTGDDKSLIVLLKNHSDFKHLEPIIEVNKEIQNNLNNTGTIWNSPNLASQNMSNINSSTSISSQQSSFANDSKKNPNVLPPSHSITDSTKQRRNTAVIAGTAMLIGTGLLGWINKDKLLPSKIVATSNNTASTVASSTAETISAPAMVTYSLNEPYTLQFNEDDLIDNKNKSDEVLKLQVVAAIPNGLSLISALHEPSATNKNKKNSQTNPLLTVTINTLPINKNQNKQSAASSTLNAINIQNQNASATSSNQQFIKHKIQIEVKADCSTISDKTSLAPFGISMQPNSNYENCQIMLPMKSISTKITALAKNTEQLHSITFDKGLSEIFTIHHSNAISASQIPVANTPVNKATDYVSSEVVSNDSGNYGDDNQIQLYYLGINSSNPPEQIATLSNMNSSSTSSPSASTPKS